MGHTEGPWTIQYSTNDYEGNLIYANQRPIASAITEEQSEVTPEDEANARLIASAPELLAALKALLESIENVNFGVHDDDGQTYDAIPWAQAEAAIAKAKGRERGD